MAAETARATAKLLGQPDDGSNTFWKALTEVDSKVARIGSTIGGDDDFKENDNSLSKQVQKLQRSVTNLSKEIRYIRIKQYIDHRVFYFKNRNEYSINYADEINQTAKMIFSVDLNVHKNFRVIFEGHSNKYKIFRGSEEDKSQEYAKKLRNDILKTSYFQDSEIRAQMELAYPDRPDDSEGSVLREREKMITFLLNKKNDLIERLICVKRGAVFYNNDSSVHKRVVLIIDEGYQQNGIFLANEGSSQGSPRPSVAASQHTSRPRGTITRQPTMRTPLLDQSDETS